MSVNEKMTAIADAIRGKTGGTEPLTLDQMATEIAGIQVGGGSGGGSDTLSVDTGHYALTAQMVTVGANTVSNTKTVREYFLDIVGGDELLAVALAETEYTVNNQFISYLGAVAGSSTHARRYRNGAFNACVWDNAGYDAKIVEGTHYLAVARRAHLV